MLVSLILVINFCVYVSSTHQNCKSTHLKGLDGSIGFNTQCEIRLLSMFDLITQIIFFSKILYIKLSFIKNVIYNGRK